MPKKSPGMLGILEESLRILEETLGILEDSLRNPYGILRNA